MTKMQIPRTAPAKLPRDGGRPVDWLTKIMADPPSPERATKIIDKLEADVQKFPFAAADMPAEVADAHRAFLEAVATARSAVEATRQAHASTVEAQEADVRLTADSLKAKTKPPAITQTKAKALEDGAIVTLQAAEVLACEAHIALTDAIHEGWSAWRRRLLEAADEKHAEATRLFAATRAAVEQRRLAYTAAVALDAQMVGRYPEDLGTIKAERRQGVPLFEAAVMPYLPGGFGHDTVVKVGEHLSAIDEHLSAPIPWTAWSPPGDPDHARLLAQPVDASAAWVRHSRRDDYGKLRCDVCGDALSDSTPLDPETLKPMHEGCTGPPSNLLPGPGLWSSHSKALRVG